MYFRFSDAIEERLDNQRKAVYGVFDSGAQSVRLALFEKILGSLKRGPPTLLIDSEPRAQKVQFVRAGLLRKTLCQSNHLR